MFLCSDGHEEVCYEGRQFPACQLKKEVEDLEDEVGQLKTMLEERE